jgi:hypothetical protein
MAIPKSLFVFPYSMVKASFLLQAVRRVKWHLRARRLVREPQMGVPCRRSGYQTGCGSVIGAICVPIS